MTRDTNAELFRLIVGSVRDYAIFLLDPTGHIATWNIGAERIKGYRADEIIGRHFSTFYSEEEVRSGKCEYELAVATDVGRFEDEGWRIRKDGTRFWANVIISAVRDESGTLIGFSKVTRDLSERRRAEEERAARRVAEEANRAKDEFLAVLGHELRNPLAPIVTALQIMKLRGDHRSSKEQQIIERQVKHMMHLVDDLLDVSRITRGKLELRRRPIDVRTAVASAIEIAGPLLEQRRHRFEVDVPQHPILVDADEARLTQVFANLLTNAAKYTDPGESIHVAVIESADGVTVRVRDNGVGIAPDLLPRVFDLFVQGRPDEETGGPTQGGLGIGLSLVRMLVEMHGGTVTAESDGTGHGSTFTVHLPVATATATAAVTSSSPPVEATATQRRRILVVDDNVDALVLVADVLTMLGHDVRTANDAPSALDVVQQFAPEVAILDIGLPVMDGYELAQRLREQLTTPPRMIALTGYGQQSDQRRSVEAGFAVHLVKPVDLQRLIESIDASS